MNKETKEAYDHLTSTCYDMELACRYAPMSKEELQNEVRDLNHKIVDVRCGSFEKACRNLQILNDIEENKFELKDPKFFTDVHQHMLEEWALVFYSLHSENIMSDMDTNYDKVIEDAMNYFLEVYHSKDAEKLKYPYKVKDYLMLRDEELEKVAAAEEAREN